MWGQVAGLSSPLTFIGIIPTRVGTRCKSHYQSLQCQDHPHACGDKEDVAANATPEQGSSPRVWGQVCLYNVDSFHDRIIPTRVGTSYRKLCNVKCLRDHPHACGDKKRLQLTGHETTGSSPRVWGQVTVDVTSKEMTRIIPTRVGTSVPTTK